MTIKIQYCSDLHLEFRNKIKIPKVIKQTNADILILAGDICAMAIDEDFSKFIVFLDIFASKYKYLLHVSGNHEMYANTNEKLITNENTINSVVKKLKNLRKTYPNYLFLDCDSIVLNINNKQYNFIGATLWTFVKPADREKIQTMMNDYSSIYIEGHETPVKLNIEEMIKMHKKHKAFIVRAVKKAKDLNHPTILITHHKPITDTLEKDITLFTQAYEIDMTSIITAPIIVSFSGHSHHMLQKIVNNVLYLSNPLGYPGEKTGFKSDHTITLD